MSWKACMLSQASASSHGCSVYCVQVSQSWPPFYLELVHCATLALLTLNPSFQSCPSVSSVSQVQVLALVCRLSCMPCKCIAMWGGRPFSSCKLCHEAVWSSGSVVGSTLASFHAKVPLSQHLGDWGKENSGVLRLTMASSRPVGAEVRSYLKPVWG